MPYADRPITKIAVQGDLSYISQQAVQQRIAPYVAASFFTIDLPACAPSWNRCRGSPTPKCAGCGRTRW
jgi:cell division protein FtsQ